MTPLREQIIRALLDGRQIASTQYAAEIGTSPQRITRELKLLGDCLARRDVSTGPGQRRVVYEAENHTALSAMLTSGAAQDFTDLMLAFGIRKADIDLPTTKHTRSEEMI